MGTELYFAEDGVQLHPFILQVQAMLGLPAHVLILQGLDRLKDAFEGKV